MFTFQKKQYEYLDASPNQTRVNERRCELPLGLAFLEEYKGKRILEVGNVSFHYKDRGYYNHDVVDLYEKVPGWPVKNEDILTWKPEGRYDATLSISTLEHTYNPLLAVNNILSYSDHVFITIPFGYNGVDKIFEAFPDLLFMKRINQDNDWKEATRDEVKGTEYNKPFLYANAFMILKR